LNRNSNLHRTLEREEFSLVYQPQMEIGPGRSLGLKR
jgi:EAL domain-containing protein (putative c-di-GMP-specific phosphodiesterase class I)